MWLRFGISFLLGLAWSVSAQNGLRGEYFDNENFTGMRLERLDAEVNFNWGQGSPIPGIGSDYFSVRWTGSIVPRFSETYTFYATSDDGIRLWINGQKILNGWSARLKTTDAGTIRLKAGNPYTIQLEFFDATVDAVASLEWSSSRQPRQIVPATQLEPAAPGVNREPNVPFLLTPYPEGVTVDAAGFLMKTEPFSDPDTGNNHACTEWEIWLVSPSELVWSSRCTLARNLTSVSLPEGEFQNSHAGRASLMPGMNYTLRVRFRDTSGAPASEWSAWTERGFNTAQPLITLIPQGTGWRVSDALAAPAAGWRTWDFPDASWRLGNAQFGFGDGDETSFTCCAAGARPITTYFRRSFVLTNAALATVLTGRLLRDDGGVVYLNGTEVFRSNLPAGIAITHSTPASSSAAERDEFYHFHPFVANPRLLREGTNSVAVEIHQSSANSGDLSFDFELLAAFTTRPAPVAIRNVGGGCLELTWNDTDMILETARDPRGPWGILSSMAGSPYLICDPLAASSFYRIRRRF